MIDTEEQMQPHVLPRQERYIRISHRDFLLENLLSSCNVLIINTPRKQKQPKETNWKQKFQKPQNENICLTYLNTENLCKREQSQARLNYAERSQGSPIGK